MIRRSKQFDLGQDKTRMKDQRDADRQHATVDALLDRFFNNREKERWDIQMLADEVGMGKTFVALGVAFSLLDHMMNEPKDLDLEKCYQKVLIITPNNSALFSKWQREVSEFVKRCVLPQYQEEAGKWFKPTAAERIDELSAEVRRTGAGSRIILANMNIFAGGKLRKYDLKRRFLLGVLFKYWGNRLQVARRETLLKGAPAGWPKDPYSLTHMEERQWDEVPFYEEEIVPALKRIEENDVVGNRLLEKLLDNCKELSEKYIRYREVVFDEKISRHLDQLYRIVSSSLIRSSFPLVIVDEAHNWKNHLNGYENFAEIIAPATRRALLLTATPFQLHPGEMLRVLELSDHMSPCPLLEESAKRRQKMKDQREKVIRPVLKKSARSSQIFTEAWMRLPRKVSSESLRMVWESPDMEDTRRNLLGVAKTEGVASDVEIQRMTDRALVGVDPDIRQLMRESLRLYACNADLSNEMGVLVVRHRRRTEHRLFKVGNEYLQKKETINIRPDSHLLHLAPGMDVQGDGELPHYLLMRCVSEMKQFKGRSSLGSALTGCYSTLLGSQEGKQVKKALQDTQLGQVYLNLLLSMVSEEKDGNHPKAREVAQSTVEAWMLGEKSLIFCFRVNTAKRLKEIIEQEIRKKLDARRYRCLGGEEKVKFLRARLTSREQDLVSIGLDRVLLSFFAAGSFGEKRSVALEPRDFTLKKEDVFELARLSLGYEVDLTGRRVDRVFLNRAIEHVISKRLLLKNTVDKHWKKLLEQIVEPTWVSHPYGLNPKEDGEDRGEDIADFDERGVHTRYEKNRDPDDKDVKKLGRELIERRNRAAKQKLIPIIETYAFGSNLWLGPRPLDTLKNLQRHPQGKSFFQAIGGIHDHLYHLSDMGDGFDWESRRKAFQAIRKALLRESVLLRLLPERADLEEQTWGRLLVEAFFSNLPGQNESMADRINVFLEDLIAASGSLSDPASARAFILSATRLRDQNFVALITGASKNEERERVFAGFNTPLLPEVLICTSVGQEGIDLHRHCRYVIHYDLAWNPAVLEQRTGRADRIGSKTFRERALAKIRDLLFLEIGVPFLAGTYDERMFEELRLRAQAFEVLTGGDLTSSSVEGHDDEKPGEGEERGIDFVPLPERMVNDLRVKLHVWRDKTLSAV